MCSIYVYMYIYIYIDGQIDIDIKPWTGFFAEIPC